MRPTVGRLVHYTNLGDRDGRYPPEVQAALITKVTQIRPDGVGEEDFDVSLRIFYEDGEFNMKRVPFTSERAGTEGARGKWCWQERV